MTIDISRIIDSESRGGTKIIFLHHSTGRLLIQLGGIRKLLHAKNKIEGANYEFWDHDYNKIGLSGPLGNRLKISLEIPNDNTDPNGLDDIFSQPVHSPADNALSNMVLFNVVITKSCFPNSAIKTEAQLDRYKFHYSHIRETISRFPNIMFILLTQPPLIPKPFPGYPDSASTNIEDALRARKFSNWMKSNDFKNGSSNIFVFDLFDLLAEPETATKNANMLRHGYRSFLGFDSHPNYRANRVIAPIFVEFLSENIQKFDTNN
jgi:hypothetical protein